MEKELPEGWEENSLESIIEFVIGGDWGKAAEFEDSDYVEVNCIRGTEFKKWDSEYGKSAVLRKVKISSLEKRKLKYGDIILEISGGGPDQPVGRVIFIENDVFENKSKLPYVCTNFSRLVRIQEHLSKKYIFLYLKYVYLNGEVIKYQGGSNNLRNLKFKEYKNIQIPLPPLPEQKRIVAKLDGLFAHIDQVKERLAKVPEMIADFRMSVLTKAVTGELTKEWRKGKKLGKWEEKLLGEVVENIQAGKNFTCPAIPVQNGQVGLVKISAVTWGTFDEKETKTVVDQTKVNKNLFIKSGDFLMTRANTIELVGANLIVKDIEHDIMLSDKVWRVTFKNGFNKGFISYFLKSRKGRNEIESRASGNQLSMRNLSQKKFKEIPFTTPPLPEQKEIVRRVESLFAKADAITAQYKLLKEQIDDLPQAVLAKAFRGEL